MRSTNGNSSLDRLSELFRTPRIPASAISAATAAIDFIVLIGVGLISFKLYVGWTNASWADSRYPLYISAVEANTILTIAVYYFSGLYRLSAIMRPWKQLPGLLVISWAIVVFFLLLAFALKTSDQFSRGWVFILGVSTPLSIYGARLAVRRLLSGSLLQDRLTRNVVIVGGGEQAERLVRRLQNRTDESRLRVVGVFDERTIRRDRNSDASACSGDLETLIRLTREGEIDEILVALPWTAEQRIREIVGKLMSLPVAIRLSPDIIGLDLRYHSFSYVGGIPALNLSERPLSAWSAFAKRCFDVVVGLLATAVLAPVMLVIALLIRLDSPGDIFFRQKRLGYNNNIFEVLKFRTLYVDKQDAHGRVLITKNDPRVTKIGRFLRRTSIDELPQLLNVLRGTMSLVGPRPHPIQATAAGMPYEKVVAEYSIRHKVRPGITGWAQINGWRGETDTTEKLSKRVEYDIEYIDNWSFLLDVLILARTIPAVVNGKGAY